MIRTSTHRADLSPGREATTAARATAWQVHTFTQRRASGWPTTMHVAACEGELLLYSPTVVNDDTWAGLDALGRVRWLLAPNHFHHLGLPRYRERFPSADVLASERAIGRLAAKGQKELRPLENVPLPRDAHFLVPEGTCSGEAWLSLESDAGRTWLVCDAFFNEPAPIRGFDGVFLRASRATPGLAIGRTFSVLCLRDVRAYARWVREALEREQPKRVLFSHGEPLESDAAVELLRVLDARLPSR